MTRRLSVGPVLVGPFVFVFMFVQLVGAQTPGFEGRAAALERGRTLTAWCYERDIGRLYGAFSAPYRAFMSREQLGAFRQEVGDGVGDEVSVEREAVSRQGGLFVYTRTATFSKFPGAMELV